MTSGQLLLEGFELMLVGMVLVFVFLVLLIGCIKVMAAGLQRFSSHETAAMAVSTPVAALPDADTLAAIQAAVHQHRSRNDR